MIISINLIVLKTFYNFIIRIIRLVLDTFFNFMIICINELVLITFLMMTILIDFKIMIIFIKIMIIFTKIKIILRLYFIKILIKNDHDHLNQNNDLLKIRSSWSRLQLGVDGRQPRAPGAVYSASAARLQPREGGQNEL